MSQEKYSLRWHNYSDHLKSMMKELMMNEHFSDVTLVTDDKKQIKANINVLSACSPVFKDILKKEKNSYQILYLRGIQFVEIESIIEFIYLGEATFYEERINEFLAVAKTLEIKELCNAELKTNDEPSAAGSGILPENLREEMAVSDLINKQTKLQDKNKNPVVHVNGSVMYACNKCDYQATRQGGLDRHIQSKHDVMKVKYCCTECDYQATQKHHLTTHIQSKHEGVKYACFKCDYKATRKDNLTTHIYSLHEGVKYPCDQCDQKFVSRSSLNAHIQNKHTF